MTPRSVWTTYRSHTGLPSYAPSDPFLHSKLNVVDILKRVSDLKAETMELFRYTCALWELIVELRGWVIHTSGEVVGKLWLQDNNIHTLLLSILVADQQQRSM